MDSSTSTSPSPSVSHTNSPILIPSSTEHSFIPSAKPETKKLSLVPSRTTFSSESDNPDQSYDTVQLNDLSDSIPFPKLRTSPENEDPDSEALDSPVPRTLFRHASEPLPTTQLDCDEAEEEHGVSVYAQSHLSESPDEQPENENSDDLGRRSDYDDEDEDEDRLTLDDETGSEDGSVCHPDLAECEADDDEDEDNCSTPVDNSELFPSSPPPSPPPLDLCRKFSGPPTESCSQTSTPLKTPRRMSTHGATLLSPGSDIIDNSMLDEERPKSTQAWRLSSQLDLSDSPEASNRTHRHGAKRARALSNLLSFSLWDHLKYEIGTADDEHLAELLKTTNQRSERVSNFLNVPIAIEKMITIGLIICLDAFFSAFTILPIKFFLSLYRLISNLICRFWSAFRRKANRPRLARLKISNKIDLMQGLLIILVCVTLHHITDASRMYHLVRGQETIKLYVIFNVLEIADRLCCSFVQDILDSLFSPSTLSRRTDGSQPRLKPIFLFILAFIFTVAHTLVLFYQLVSLNVAINSYDHSLITLLISNQFVEIKGSVFKKFEKENLFQMSCADIVERFQIALMLTIIAFRNMIELWDSASTTAAPSFTPSHAYSHTYQYLPTSFKIFPSLSLLQTIFMPPIIVILSEVIVDWLKHAFITKFNHIRPTVYGRFIDVLCIDLAGDDKGYGARKIKPFVDKSPAVSRRMGFSVFPICCLTVRVIFQAWDMISEVSNDDYATPGPPCTPTEMLLTLKYNLARSPLVPTSLKSWLPSSPPIPPITSPSTSAFSCFQLNLLLSLSVLIGLSFLILTKLFLGIWLRLYAEDRLRSLEERVVEDELNDRGRMPIGTSEAELRKEREECKLIASKSFDVPPQAGGKGGAKIPMEELGRFDMVRSRIW
ncbi:hypothetical protein CROQUDRAFT_62025 [Cronartium quercuum f. sp. fusiforme G11]|uniref:Uncharacterized protein n=1 Tax=Cronartium quercuum f. sp. fusiforme G11 TaxID=708437 RepID=A0A9P6NJI6_9BASI|nr:hypothetical protein CROQUDRAFT_62025 [Cronartium quercuum f. sp. fusiforme G11]